ncbi:MAG: M12 family metallo-peptidase [Lentimicrobiaceae bacterium]|nr:M12 family metallo-peptidase [Lentimicrobiaceae bacterium]
MRKLPVLLSVFCLVGFSLFGQRNVLYFEIQQAKESNLYFENVVLPAVDTDTEVLKNFINPDEVSFLGNISLDLRNNPVKAMNLLLPLQHKNMILELIETPEDFYDYVVTTSAGEAFVANRNIKHYRGVIKDNINSLVAITFYEDEIMGLICTEEGNFNIVKDQQSNKHFFYNDQNLKEKSSFTCGNTNDFPEPYESEVLFGHQHREILDKRVRFYAETEYDIYQARGSVSSVEVFISGLFNQVGVLYQNENIFTGISEIHIWTTEDPYTGASTDILLYQFQHYTNSLHGDLGILLTFRGVGGGMAAGFSGLCNHSVAQSLSVAQLYNDYATVPVYSWSVMVVTHELGHLFGSRHTHACVWNGDETAIDGCAGYVEGYCALLPSPPEGGTIMSYCHMNVGINFNLGFGPQPGNVIRNRVANANCLLRLILEVMDIRISNEAGKITPGETTDLYIYLKNIGDDTAYELTATLSSSSPYLIINEATAHYGYFSPEQYRYRVYNITLSSDTPEGTTELPVTLTTTDASGRTLGIDAVFHFQNTGEPPQSCSPVENFSAEATFSNITLTWTAPADGTPKKYLIYCNGLFLTETTATTYTHEVGLGTYHYCIEALYEDGCTGETSCVEAVTPCNMDIELTAAPYSKWYRLFWTPVVINASYKIYRDTELLTTTIANHYDIINLNTQYCYTIVAVCPGDMESEPSNEKCVGGVGIDELENDIKIYPNPANTSLFIEGTGLKTISIYNVLGQVVDTIETDGKATTTINTSSYQPALYIVEIIMENGRKINKQLVISR